MCNPLYDQTAKRESFFADQPYAQIGMWLGALAPSAFVAYKVLCTPQDEMTDQEYSDYKGLWALYGERIALMAISPLTANIGYIAGSSFDMMGERIHEMIDHPSHKNGKGPRKACS